MMGGVSQTWWTVELLLSLVTGGSLDNILKLTAINLISFWAYFINTLLSIVPGLNFVVPVLGFLVYLYVAFQY